MRREQMGGNFVRLDGRPDYERFLAVFEIFDADQDGFITPSEMNRGLNEVRRRVNADIAGAESSTDVVLLETTNVDALFASSDTDGNHLLSFEEFYNAATQVKDQANGEAAMSEFPWFVRFSAASLLPTIVPQPVSIRYVQEYMTWWPPNARHPLPLFLVTFSLLQIVAFVYYSREVTTSVLSGLPSPT